MTQDMFEAFGDTLIAAPVKRMRESEARRAAKKAEKPPMVLQGLEKKQAEKAKQMIRYRQWKAEVREGMSRGDYGREIIDLFKLMRSRTRAIDYVNFVLGAKWMLKCNEDVRTTLLGYLGHAMALQNVRNGYPPFNDALPGEPSGAFLIIRKHLTGVGND
jgi:hypothetical protein